MAHKHITSRRWLGVPLAVWLWIASASVALALFVFVLFVNGTITVASGEVKYSTAPGVTTNFGTCSGTYPDDRRLALTWTAPFPGDTCEIVVVFASKTNSTAMRLQRFTAPVGITGVLGGDCGKTIQPADPNTPAASVTLTVDPGTTAGQVITFGPDAQGFEWVKSSDYVAADCT